MTDETLRSRNRWVIWLGIAITLGPLVPYAARGLSDRSNAQPDIQAPAPAPAGAAMSYLPVRAEAST